QFFDSQRRPVETVELHGSVELAPRVGLADGVLDVAMSGRTLRDNPLDEVAEVLRSTARPVVKRVSLRANGRQLRPLIGQMPAGGPADSTSACCPGAGWSRLKPGSPWGFGSRLLSVWGSTCPRAKALFPRPA